MSDRHEYCQALVGQIDQLAAACNRLAADGWRAVGAPVPVQVQAGLVAAPQMAFLVLFERPKPAGLPVVT